MSRVAQAAALLALWLGACSSPSALEEGGAPGLLQARAGLDVALTANALAPGGNEEGGVELTAAGVRRTRAQMGAGSWGSAGAFATGRERHASVVYNGFAYVLGGSNPAYLADVQVAALLASGAAGAFSATAPLPSPRAGHSAVAYDGYLYVLGGVGAGGYLDEVQVAPISADGTLGPFAPTTPFSGARAGHTSAVQDGYLYVLGGYDGTTRRADVQVARLNADGTVGPWAATTALPAGRELHASAAQAGRLYVVGGNTGAARLADVQVAAQSADGTLGAWRQVGMLGTARDGHAALVHAGYLYVLGGNTGAARLADVQVAPVRAGGGLGPFTASAAFPNARDGHTAVARQGFLYLLGGYDGTARRAEVLSAPLTFGGQVQAWSTTTALPTAAYQSSSVAYNGFIYNLGGSGGSLSASRYARINPDGTLGTWANATPLGVNRFAHWMVAYNNFLYVVGGYDTNFRNTVHYARINADGSLGTWATTTPFLTARREHKAVAHNGYLYVLGGENGGALNSVEYAQLNPDGTVGTWAATTAFATPRSCFSAVSHDRYLYLIGGFVAPDCSGGNAATANIQYAAINGNGTLGAWTATASLPLARESMGAAVHNGRLYLAGGYDTNPVPLANVAPFNADGTLGPWQTMTSLPAPRDWTHMVTQDGWLYLLGGYTNSAQSTVYRAAITDGSQGTVGAFAATTPLPSARSGHAAVAAAGHLYLLGGSGAGLLQDVYEAPVGPDGTLGPWSAAGAFSTARSGHAAVACGGYLYVLGGFDGAARRADVQVAALSASGTVGPWAGTTGFNGGRERHAALCHGGYLYVLGGFDGAARRADVQLAAINPDGTVGAWTAGPPLPAARSGLAAVVQDGQLYVAGGFDGTNRLNDVWGAPLGPSGMPGGWSRKAGFSVAREGHSAVAFGGQLYVLGGNSGAYASSVEVASFVSGGGLGSWSFSSSFSTGREALAAVAAEGFLYVLGGSNGAPLGDVQVAALGSSSRRGIYSRLFDFGAPVEVSALRWSGTPAKRGTVALEVRGAPGSALLAAPVRLGVVPPDVPAPLALADIRYLWVKLTLDDALADGVTVDGSPERDVTDLTVTYSLVATGPDGGQPQPQPLPTGAACQNGAQCQSGRCAAGACTEPELSADGGLLPLRLGVGCGCGALGPAEGLAAVALVSAALLRRRRSRASRW